jgi:hypothetical protein
VNRILVNAIAFRMMRRWGEGRKRECGQGFSKQAKEFQAEKSKRTGE